MYLAFFIDCPIFSLERPGRVSWDRKIAASSIVVVLTHTGRDGKYLAYWLRLSPVAKANITNRSQITVS